MADDLSDQLKKDPEGVEALLESAYKGERPTKWIERAIESAGFIKVASRSILEPVLLPGPVLLKHFKMAASTLAEWGREGCPIYRKGAGPKPALYDLFALLQWKDDRELARKMAEGDDGVDYGGPSESTYLEKMRKEKARELERKNLVAEGELVYSNEIRVELAAVANEFRAAAEAIEKAHGEAVGKDIRNMVDRAQAAWERVAGIKLEETDGDDKQ